MTSPDELKAKRTEFDRVIIKHKLFAEALQMIDDSLELSDMSVEPASAIITGPPGTGKSTLCRTVQHIIEQRFPPTTEITPDGIRKTISVVSCALESGVTIKGLAKSMLKDLGVENAKGDQTDLTLRLYDLLKTCETKLILMDEFQHLLQRGAVRSKELVCDWVKNLMCCR